MSSVFVRTVLEGLDGVELRIEVDEVLWKSRRIGSCRGRGIL